MSSDPSSFAHILARELLTLSFRATLHRLRGVRSLLSGWAMLGPGSTEEKTLNLRLKEDKTLLARLDWIHSFQNTFLDPALLLSGEAPAVLLAARLGLGTPEEAYKTLPSYSEPGIALGIAFTLQALARTAADPNLKPLIHIQIKNGQTHFQLPEEWGGQELPVFELWRLPQGTLFDSNVLTIPSGWLEPQTPELSELHQS